MLEMPPAVRLSLPGIDHESRLSDLVREANDGPFSLVVLVIPAQELKYVRAKWGYHVWAGSVPFVHSGTVLNT